MAKSRKNKNKPKLNLTVRVPTMRRIIGKPEIDVYRNGLMFERDNVGGVTKR